MKRFNLEERFGFTLPEILIALGIIGIVAAITIPIVMQVSQKQQLIAALKENAAIITSAGLSVASENGGTFEELCSNWNSSCLLKAFQPYLKVHRTCPTSARGDCWPNNSYSLYQYNIGITDSTVGSYNSEVKAVAVLLNGACVSFVSSANEYGKCGSNCGTIYIDVNCMKGPNTLGKDLFLFYIFKNKILPSYDPVSWSCIEQGAGSTENYNSGGGCAGKYLSIDQ